MKFRVFKNGKVLDKFVLNGAYLFGTDGISIRRAKISFRNGVVDCKKATDETSGMALLWHVDGFGDILLPTTCLPERKEPYILNVEIARAKLKRIVNKREDWGFFDDIGKLEKVAGEAQKLLTGAIQNISDVGKASQYADESLKKSMICSEKLALKHASELIESRKANRGFGKACLGCKIDSMQMGNPNYVERLLEVFGFVTIPVNWAKIEVSKDQYDFRILDAVIDILSKKKVAIGAGPLLCFSKFFLPRWLWSGKVTFEKIRETAYQFVSKITSRYSGRVSAWSVISGLNAFNHFGFSFQQIFEMTRAANMAAKAANDRSLKIIEVNNPWGEYYSTTPHTIPPLIYMDMVVQSGINFDAFGLPMRFGRNQSGMYVRDMMQISSILDTYGPISKPLYITGVEVPSQRSSVGDAGVGGVWHREWDQDCQKEWIEQFYRIALSKQFVDSVTYSTLSDLADSPIVNSGLLNYKLETKKSFSALKNLHDEIFSKGSSEQAGNDLE